MIVVLWVITLVAAYWTGWDQATSKAESDRLVERMKRLSDSVAAEEKSNG
jgi:hypothetical protein